MTHDPAVLYDRLTRHVARCDDCGTRGSEYCSSAAALLKAWGDADKFAQRLSETDATGFSLDDEYLTELGRS